MTSMALNRVSPELQKILQNHLNLYSRDNPFEIFICGKNADDGIGDFVHVYDFYKYLKSKLRQDDRIRITAACIVSEKKFEIIKKIYPEFSGLVFPEGFTVVVEVNEEIFRSKKHLVMPMSYAVITEFSFPKEKFPFSYYCPFWEYEESGPHAMGIEQTRRGIKIIEPIVLNKTSLEKGEKIDDTFEAPWLNPLFPDIRKNNMAFIGVGYTQGELNAAGFVDACLAQVENQNEITIAIDSNCFDRESGKFSLTIKFAGSHQYEHSFMDQLKQLGVTRMQWVSASGEIEEVPVPWEVPADQPSRLFRMVHMKGISDHDKHLLMAMSDSVVASGDTSFSELVSSSSFPVICKKKDIMKSILRYIEKKENAKEFNELEEYIRALPNLYISSTIMECIKTNREKILHQWKMLCAEVIKNRNVNESIDREFAMSVVHSIMMNGTKGEKAALRKFEREYAEMDSTSKKLLTKNFHPDMEYYSKKMDIQTVINRMDFYCQELENQDSKLFSFFRVNPRDKIKLAQAIQTYLRDLHGKPLDKEVLDGFIQQDIKINGLFGKKGRLRSILTNLQAQALEKKPTQTLPL